MVNIFVNGEMKAQVMADTSERIIVPNGSYTLMARQAGKGNINFSTNIEANSQRFVFNVVQIFKTISLFKQSEMSLSNLSIGISRAVTNIGNKLADELPKSSSIAVLSISANQLDSAAFVISELEYILVSKGYNIVDRHSLDAIKKEQDFQMSGYVSDESAVSIGHTLGANIVITGSLTESNAGNSLSVKALDVKTSQIISMPREFY